MAIQIVRDQKVWFGGYDFAGVVNSLALDAAAELVDATVLGDDTRTRMGGLKTVAAQLAGFLDPAVMGSVAFDQVGLADAPLSFAASASEGARAFAFQAAVGRYAPVRGGQGELVQFGLDAEGASSLVRGTLMANQSAVVATGNGDGRQLGAVTAAQSLYASLHVLSAGGTTPTLDVSIQSDDNSGFTSATTRASFAQAAAVGGQWLTPVAGAITDDWWRVTWTLGGTSPDFDFVVVVGIQ